jgi:hypothetical protein
LLGLDEVLFFKVFKQKNNFFAKSKESSATDPSYYINIRKKHEKNYQL